jgi:hypothetical protein
VTKYVFDLETMHVDVQRGKVPDKDVVTFGVQIGTEQFGPLTRYIDDSGHGIVTGETIHFSTLAPDNPRHRWEIGPIEVSTDDIVNFIFAAVNTSDSAEILSRGDQTKTAMVTWTSLVAVGIAATGVGAIPAAIIAGVGAVLSEVIGDLVPDTPHCNGVVVAQKIPLTAGEIARGVADGLGTMRFTQHGENTDIPDACGHPSEADVTYSITAVPAESTESFLGPTGDLQKGIRRLRADQTIISVRDLIQSWSWTQTLPSG